MKLFFRSKENGASVFRYEEDDRNQRSDLLPIAEANSRNGNIKIRSGIELTDGETAAINEWIAVRRKHDDARDAALPQAAIEALNAAAHWISGQPDPKVLDEKIDDMLVAMLDLRTAIIRYKSKRVADETE